MRARLLVAPCVLLPLAACALLGAATASLWLDEILYWYYEWDLALRAAEIGRPAASLAPFFSNFLFCDVARLFQLPLVWSGLDPARSPELFVRAISIVSTAAASLLLYGRRASREGAASGLLGALVFAATPLLLYYAFEARVYAFVSLLVVLLLDLLARFEEHPSRGRLVGLALLGVVIVRLQLWTVCLFGSLLCLAAVSWLRTRRWTTLVGALSAASVPAIGSVVVEYAYMKATEPPDPLFELFRRQPLGATLRFTVTSIFRGAPQVQFAVPGSGEPVALAIGALALAALVVMALVSPAREHEGEWTQRTAVAASLLALAFSVALACGFGYFVHGRYQTPLVAALLTSLAAAGSRRQRLLQALYVTVALGLVPITASRVVAKANGSTLAALILGQSDRTSTAVVVQHGVPSGYPAPHHTIGLDFYLNVVRPTEAEVPIYELPGLGKANGKRGVYEYFNGGQALFGKMLEARPEAWRSWAVETARPDVWVVHTLWGVEVSDRQVRELLGVLGSAGYRSAGRFVVPGYPRAMAIHLKRG